MLGRELADDLLDPEGVRPLDALGRRHRARAQRDLALAVEQRGDDRRRGPGVAAHDGVGAGHRRGDAVDDVEPHARRVRRNFQALGEERGDVVVVETELGGAAGGVEAEPGAEVVALDLAGRLAVLEGERMGGDVVGAGDDGEDLAVGHLRAGLLLGRLDRDSAADLGDPVGRLGQDVVDVEGLAGFARRHVDLLGADVHRRLDRFGPTVALRSDDRRRRGLAVDAERDRGDAFADERLGPPEGSEWSGVVAADLERRLLRRSDVDGEAEISGGRVDREVGGDDADRRRGERLVELAEARVESVSGLAADVVAGEGDVRRDGHRLFVGAERCPKRDEEAERHQRRGQAKDEDYFPSGHSP